MRRILLILRNDIKRRLKSPMSIIVLLIIPVMMTGIIGAVFAPSSENKMVKINIFITDKDKGPGSKFFIEAFKYPKIKEMFNLQILNEKEGKTKILNNNGSALIIIPKGFSENLVNKKETNLIFIKNPAEQFLPNIVEEIVHTLSMIISGAIQTFEIDSDLFNKLNIENKNFIKSIITNILKNKNNTKTLNTLKKVLNPPLLNLKKEISDKRKETNKLNLFSYILPGISIMFLLFIIEIFIRDILSERENGKLQRMMFAPLKAKEYIIARILSGWFMGIITYTIVILMGIFIFKIKWGNYLFLFILILITCFWIAAFFSLLNAFFKNRNQAGAFIAPIVMIFSAFGGSIISIDQLPGSFRWIANLTLNHWFIVGANDIRNYVFPTLPILILSVSGIILFILATKSLNKRIII